MRHRTRLSTFARPFTAAVAALALAGALAPAGAGAAGQRSSAKLPASASLAQCLTSVQQDERSATFSGEMSSIAGAARMEIRIDVLERLPGEESFHLVIAPGLGVWRASAPGVKVFKYLKQVTNLSAPALYRASVRFRWLNGHARPIKVQALRTAPCEQSAPEGAEEAPASA